MNDDIALQVEYLFSSLLFSSLLLSSVACGPTEQEEEAVCRSVGPPASFGLQTGTKTASCATDRVHVKARLKAVQDAAYLAQPVSAQAAFQTVLTPYGTPRLLYGGGMRLKPSKPAADPLSAALDIAMTHKALLGLGQDDALLPDPVVSGGGIHRVYLRQIHAGVEVAGAGLYLVLNQQHEAFAAGNSTVPDILDSPVAVVASSAAESTLSALHAGYMGESVALAYRPSATFCDTARLAWRIRYRSANEPGEAWVDAHDGAVLEDRLGGPQVANVGVYNQTNYTTNALGSPVKVCGTAACPGGLPPRAAEICTGLTDLWNYWANTTLHGGFAIQDYNNSNKCLAANLTCQTPGSASAAPYDNPPIEGEYAWADAAFQTKGVVAHELGHLNTAWSVEGDPPNQDKPIYEHMADMAALAIDSQWKIVKVDGCPVRNWQLPSSVTTTCDGKKVYYPDTFDEVNEHSWRYDGAVQRTYPPYYYYFSWHTPSTMWSHMIYNLAQKPGLNRQKAASVVYRTMRDHLHNDADIAMTPYQFYLQLEADSMGSPYDSAMRDVQEQARLWKFSELILNYCHRRPGMAFVWNAYIHQLQVFYREKMPGQSDKLLLAFKDFDLGVWTIQDTGLSPSTADSALTAGYQYDLFAGKIFLAWTRYDLIVHHTWRNLGGGWASPQAIPGVISTHAPVIAVGSDVRLFYRNADTGSLSFVRWNGSSWGSPVNLTSLVGQVAREPTVEWDGSKYVLMYVSGAENAEGEVKYIEITPGVGGGPDSYSAPPPVTFHECAYTLGPHNWSGQIASAWESGKLNLLGFREDVALHQAAMSFQNGTWKFWHHAYTERVGDEIVVRSGAPGLYAALWSWDPNGSSANIFSK